MLEGKNIQLRTVQENDLGALYSFFDSIRMKGDYLPADLLSEHQFRLNFYETGFWAEGKGTLVLIHQGRMVGAVWFEKQSYLDCLDLQFYIFQEEDRGKEWMREGLSLFANYLFATKKVERLQISIPDYSKRAIRLTQKCGFQFEGIARSALFRRGKYLDVCIYSLLRSELEKIYLYR